MKCMYMPEESKHRVRHVLKKTWREIRESELSLNEQGVLDEHPEWIIPSFQV